MRPILLFFIGSLFLSISGFAGDKFDLEVYVDETDSIPDSIFFSQFPYGDYLAKKGMPSLKKLEAHRKYLENAGRDPEKFLSLLVNQYTHNPPLSPDQLNHYSEMIRLAESFYNVKGILTTTYPILADELFSLCGATLDKQLKEEQLSKDNEEVAYLVKRLEENKYIVNVPVSTWEKFQVHFWSGNWDYILDRMATRHPYSLAALLAAGLAFVLFVVRRIRSRRQGRSVTKVKKQSIPYEEVV